MAVQAAKTDEPKAGKVLWYEDEFTGGAWKSGGTNSATQWDTRPFKGNQIAGIRVEFELLSNGNAGSSESDVRPNGLTSNLQTNGFSLAGPGGAPANSGEPNKWLLNGVAQDPKLSGWFEVMTRAGVYRRIEMQYSTYSLTAGGPHYSIKRDGLWLDLATEITSLRWAITSASVAFQNGTKIRVYLLY